MVDKAVMYDEHQKMKRDAQLREIDCFQSGISLVYSNMKKMLQMFVFQVTVQTLIGKVGGILGITLGWSAMTFFELFGSFLKPH